MEGAKGGEQPRAKRGDAAEAAFPSRAELIQQAIAAAKAAIRDGCSPASARHAHDVAISVQRQLAARALLARARARRGAAADGAATATAAASA